MAAARPRRAVARCGPIPVALLLLAGCGPQLPVPTVPVLSLSRRDCDPRPDFAAALPVRTESWRGTSAALEATGRCMAVPGSGPTPYAVFALPTDQAPYTLAILSRAGPATIVRPVATLYDAAGQPVRTVPPEEFETTIAGLRAGVRPRGTERWLVVAADQARLGQTLVMQLGSLPDVRVQTAATVYVPIIIVPPAQPDLVRQRSAIFSLTGTITVVAAPARSVNYAVAAASPGPFP